MRINITFLLLLLILTTAGSFGVYKIMGVNSISSSSVAQPTSISPSPTIDNSASSPSQEIRTTGRENNETSQNVLLGELEELIESGNYFQAVALVNARYSQLSTTQLQQVNNYFLSHANLLSDERAIDLLLTYNDEFNDLDVWTELSKLHIKTKQWTNAIESLLSAVAIEYRPEKIAILHNNLVLAASHVSNNLESRNDELGINQLYQNLNESLPENTRFQLELANSHLRLNNIEQARYLLEPLQYDIELGEIASITLTKLNENLQTSPKEIISEPTPARSRNEIVVPLQRAGNSFFVNTEINRRKINLLLDTGASITSLSSSLIQQLNLKPDGRTIRLSTANGIRNAKLYRADQIKLGRLSIKNLVVAEIEFSSNSPIQGLLGTDLLNQLDNNYSYIIDNQKNALIFQAK